MANWQRKLDLLDVWGKAQDEEISTKELSGIVADRLAALPDFGIEHIDIEKEDLVNEFRLLSEEEGIGFDEFNFIFAMLYNWADQTIDGKFNGKKVCWVATNF